MLNLMLITDGLRGTDAKLVISNPWILVVLMVAQVKDGADVELILRKLPQLNVDMVLGIVITIIDEGMRGVIVVN